jgi:hypothetical protein
MTARFNPPPTSCAVTSASPSLRAIVVSVPFRAGICDEAISDAPDVNVAFAPSVGLGTRCSARAKKNSRCSH